MNMETIDVIEEAHGHIKDQEKYTDKLEDIILDSKEAKMHQAEINDKLKDLVDHEEQEDDVDDLLKDLEMEMKTDNKKKIAEKGQGIAVPATQKAKVNKEEDDIERMLAEI